MNESDSQHLSKVRTQTGFFFFPNVKSVSFFGGKISLFELSFLTYSCLQEKKGEEAAYN